jgi:hypothetical protein
VPTSYGRVSTFDPLTLNGLIAWWSPRFGVVAPNGGQLVSWTDIVSGKIITGTTANGTLTYRSSGINGRPAFFGVTAAGQPVGTGPTLSISQPNTTYVVMSDTASTFIGADGLSARQILGSPGGVNSAPGMFAGASINSTFNVSGPNVYCGSFNGTASAQYINSSAVPAVTGSAGANALGQVVLGTGTAGGQGFIGDLLYFSGLHGPAERSAVMGWLSSLYSVQGG